MRALGRNGTGYRTARQWPRSAWVATGLGLGAVGGFLGSLARERRGTVAARQSAAAYRGWIPGLSEEQPAAGPERSLDQLNEMRY